MGFQIVDRVLDEIVVLALERHTDERGWFSETFRADLFERLGLPAHFLQANHSRSHRGVLRGLHFQWQPPMGKLMRVTRGRACLVAADIRPASPHFRRWHALEAAAEDPLLVWAPAGFARGFCALADDTEIEYLCTAVYEAGAQRRIRWDDPELAIRWPVEHPRLSAQDAQAPSLREWLARGTSLPPPQV